MSELTDRLREVARAYEALARALEAEDGRLPRDPRRAERIEEARHAAIARAAVDPAFRRRLFSDPERVLGRTDEGFDRLAAAVRDLDEALERTEDGSDFADRGIT